MMAFEEMKTQATRLGIAVTMMRVGTSPPLYFFHDAATGWHLKSTRGTAQAVAWIEDLMRAEELVHGIVDVVPDVDRPSEAG